MSEHERSFQEGATGGGESSPRRRQFVRWPFAQQFIPLRLTEQTPQHVLATVCRNLSCGGAGLLVKTALTMDQQVVVGLRSLVSGTAEVAGKIVRCEEIRHGHFDIGIAFEGLIDVREFIPLDPFEAPYVVEHVDPGTIAGRMGLVSRSVGDRSAILAALKATRTQTVVSFDGKDLEQEASVLDVLFVGASPQDAPAGEVLLHMLSHGFRGRVVLVMPDRSERSRRTAEKLPFHAVLVRPVETAHVLRALAQALLDRGEQAGGAACEREAA